MEVRINEEKVNRMKRSYRNKKRKKKIKTLFLLILIIIAITYIIFIKNRKSSDMQVANTESLLGKWTTDGNTIYNFNDNNSGILIVPLTTIPFSYEIKDNKIYIDFESEDSEDKIFEYIFEKNKLILKNMNGVFEFNKLED